MKRVKFKSPIKIKLGKWKLPKLREEAKRLKIEAYGQYNRRRLIDVLAEYLD